MKKYFMGDAYNNELKAEVEILILAEDEAEAQKHYEECIKRHSVLIAIRNPNIAEFWGDFSMLKERNKDEIFDELENTFSVPVCI